MKRIISDFYAEHSFTFVLIIFRQLQQWRRDPTIHTKIRNTVKFKIRTVNLIFTFGKNNPALCNALEQDKIIPTLEIRQKASNFTWATFWALQVLDVYSTRKGLQYDCVKRNES